MKLIAPKPHEIEEGLRAAGISVQKIISSDNPTVDFEIELDERRSVRVLLLYGAHLVAQEGGEIVAFHLTCDTLEDLIEQIRAYAPDLVAATASE